MLFFGYYIHWSRIILVHGRETNLFWYKEAVLKMFISLSRSAFSDEVLFWWTTRRLVCEAMRDTWRKRNMMMMMMRTPARAESDDSRVSPFTRGEKVQDLPEEPPSLDDIETSSPSQPNRVLPKQELVSFHSKARHLWIWCAHQTSRAKTRYQTIQPDLTNVRFNTTLFSI